MLATTIMIVHVAILMWNVYAPFSKIPWVRTSYVVFAPFLMLHWLLNDDTCALTLLECKIRDLDDVACRDRSFVHRIVSPVYKITDTQARVLVWTFTIAAWVYAASKTTWTDVSSFFGV